MKNLIVTLSLALTAIYTNAQCVADYSIDASGDPTFVFTDLSTVPPGTTYYWDFGDGNYSYLQNPTHTYAANGWYLLCLYVQDSTSGCFDMRCDSIFVNGISGSPIADSLGLPCAPCLPPGIGCTADFSFTISGGTVTFDDNSTVPASANYYWDFGDGTYSTVENPAHAYSSNGTYMVCLWVYDSLTSCSSYICDTIVISGIGSGGPLDSLEVICPICDSLISPPPTSCDADFWMIQDSSSTNTWYFIDNSSGAVNYFWDFGDGNTSSSANPVHTYASPGTYIVCLTIWSATCSDTLCQTISFFSGGSERTDEIEAPTRLKDPTSYPNPARDQLTIEFDADQDELVHVQLFDITGQSLNRTMYPSAIGTNKLILDVSELSEGTYFWSLSTNDGEFQETQAFIKTR